MINDIDLSKLPEMIVKRKCQLLARKALDTCSYQKTSSPKEEKCWKYNCSWFVEEKRLKEISDNEAEIKRLQVDRYKNRTVSICEG